MSWPPGPSENPFAVEEQVVLGEPVEVFTHRPQSLADLLAHTDRFDDREYLVIDEHRLTYQQVREMVYALAEGLATEYGIGHGDRVAILGENRVEWLLTFWALANLGAIAVGMNSWWSADEMAVYLADADPKAAVVSTRMADRFPPVDIPRIVMDDVIDTLIEPYRGAGRPAVEIDEDDPVVILYTSGTTGRSKGAVNSHRNAVAMVMLQTSGRVAMARQNPDLPPEIGATTYPFFHVSGLYGSLLCPTMVGDTTIFVTGKFDAAKTLRAIEAEKVNKVSIVPTTGWRIVRELRANPDTYDVSSMIRVTGGGAPMTEPLQDALREVFPGIQLAFGYGLTECAGLATGSPDTDLREHPNTAGKPYPTVQVQIRDESDNVLPVGEEGLVLIRGAMVMPGYWQNQSATDTTIAPGRWLRTGDLGTLFEDGRLELTARRSDLILRGGENVYPAEIETVLESHPQVMETAVVGAPHPDLGEEVCAHVVVDSDITAEDLTEYCKARLGYFKVPSRWFLRRDPLPRTPSGKVVRKDLKVS